MRFFDTVATITLLVISSQVSAVIYSEDTREDIRAPYPNPVLATATLIDQKNLSSSNNRIWNFRKFKLSQAYPLCGNEKFLDQYILGYCTGVLIAPQLVLTAGHCLRDQTQCSKTHLVFGWTQNRTQTGIIADNQVYHCKRLQKQQNSPARSGVDYAVLELDRPVTQAKPVKIVNSSSLTQNNPVVSLSYPLGLPLKSDRGFVLENQASSIFISAAVDTFAGSSGSGLFNSSGELLGILSRGSDDFLEDNVHRVQTEGGCIEFHRCDKTQICRGEKYFKASLVPL